MRVEVTQIEKDIGSMGEQVRLTLSRSKGISNIWNVYSEFELCHVEILSFIAALESKETVFDEHVNVVSEIIEPLE